MTVLKYWDQASGTYKAISGPPGPVGPQGPAGSGFPVGGGAGTILTKNTAADFDTGWQPVAASPWGRNILINGNFERAQRIGETSGNFITVPASSGPYSVDRWYHLTNVNQAGTVYYYPASAGVGFTGNVGICNIQRNAGQTGVSALVLAQPLDADQINHLQGKIVTATVRFATAANWSAPSLNVQLLVGTGAPAKRGAGFTGEVQVLLGTIPTAPSQATMTASFTSSAAMPANATQGELRLYWIPVGTAGAGDILTLGNVQLEVGAQFTGFDYRPAAIEWQLCQRFYQKSFQNAAQPGPNLGSNGTETFLQVGAAATSQWVPSVTFPVRMRVGPSIIIVNPFAGGAAGQIRNYTNNSDWSATGVGQLAENGFALTATSATGSTVGSMGAYHWTAEAEI